MDESIKKFYLYDRWFYFQKETEDKIVYKSNSKRKLNGILVEFSKEIDNVDVLYFDNDKLISKLTITNIQKNKTEFHYQDKEPQLIHINDNTYVNLLIELFTNSDDKFLNKKTIKITKKNNLKKLCYREPDFKLDTEISLNSLKIESKILNYFIELIDYIKRNKDVLRINIKEKESEKEEEIIEECPKNYNLVIPSDLYIYDRNYTLIGEMNNNVYYENNQDGYTLLEVRPDPNSVISRLTLHFKKEASSKNEKYVLQMLHNSLNGVTVRYQTAKKAEIRIKSDTINDYDNAQYLNTIVYDGNNAKMSDRLQVKVGKIELDLTSHPYFSNTYVDENGNEYHMGSSDFAKLEGIACYAPGIYNGIKEKFLN